MPFCGPEVSVTYHRCCDERSVEAVERRPLFFFSDDLAKYGDDDSLAKQQRESYPKIESEVLRKAVVKPVNIKSITQRSQ
jgi:hypothetical protein